eukprot:4077410-Pleurochrysis_carterae.AAC.2
MLYASYGALSFGSNVLRDSREVFGVVYRLRACPHTSASSIRPFPIAKELGGERRSAHFPLARKRGDVKLIGLMNQSELNGNIWGAHHRNGK